MANTFHVIGLNDHPDGNAYEDEHHGIITPRPMTTLNFGELLETALQVLSKNDHVLICDEEPFEEHAHDLISLAPYSIHITKGIHA